MNDFLILSIPFDSSHVLGDDEGRSWLGVDLHDFGVNIGSHCVVKDYDGFLKPQVLHHIFESLPTHFTGMAFKIYDRGIGKSAPFVQLKASPAKLMQGHNVFGSDSIERGATEMLMYLAQTYPTLYSMLYIPDTQVRTIDVTYSARLKSDSDAQKVLNYIRNVSGGQTSKGKKQFETTAYWGGEKSLLKQIKLYMKNAEFHTQLQDYQKRAKKNDHAAMRVVEVMSDPRLQAWTVGLIRWEARLKSRWFERRGISTNLFDLIRYQRANPNCMRDWWIESTADIFKAFEGQKMTFTNDAEVFESIRLKFTRITPKGRVSHVKANNLMRFYRDLRDLGCEEAKRIYSAKSSQFYVMMSDLISCGFSRAHLQNLHDDRKNNIVPLLRFVNVDFSAQLPDWYVEPVSNFSLSAA